VKKKKADDDAEFWRRRFPTAAARAAADQAIDALPISLPMSAYLDEWLRAYRVAGGKEPALTTLPKRGSS
jgi:hypothetical protein